MEKIDTDCKLNDTNLRNLGQTFQEVTSRSSFQLGKK